MLILNKDAVAQSLSHAECVEVLDQTMRSVSKRDVIMPLRQFIAIPDTPGKFTMMPGYLGEPRCFGVKLVSKYPREAGSPHGSHVGAVMVYDADTGLPQALLDGAELTAIRTSAASALATRELARKDASVLTIMGCGDEARHHIQAVSAVRDLTEIIVWGRSLSKAQAFVDDCISRNLVSSSVKVRAEADAETAVSQGHIVCTVTAATTPILQGAWLKAGTHVNLVGAAIRTSAEADQDVVTQSRFYIDYRESAMAQAGELLDALEAGAIDESHIVGELGELLAGDIVGRQDETEITVYKSLGVAAQDLAAGKRATENAERDSLGVVVDW